MSNSRFTTYTVSGLDTDWAYQPTVRDVLYQLAGEEPTPFEGHHPGTAFDLNTRRVKGFLQDWEAAHQLARDAGMRRHQNQATRVFWVPTHKGFQYGFVLQEYNQSTTYVVAPVPLPHLETNHDRPEYESTED